MDPISYVKKEPYKLYIDGQFVESESGKTFDAINPVNNEVFATGYLGDIADAEKAILAARKAFDEGPWPAMNGKERGKLLLKAAAALERRKEEFAVIETLDVGKLYMSALYYEAPKSLEALEYNAGKAQLLDGLYVPVDEHNMNVKIWEPYGVVGEILPWNGPFMMGCQKISTILAAGNTVVVKPSSMASITTMLLAEVFDEAGFPPGVVNIITGPGGKVGDALVQSELVDMVAMTGGTDTGQHIIKASADSVKEIALELGGKSPNIIFEDVDTDLAARWARWAFTLNSGQVCVAGTRLLVQRSIYEEILEKLAEECAKFVPGNGFDYEKGVDFSTLVSKSHANEVWGYIETGKKEGARLICGGEPFTDPVLQKGNFVPATVFADVTPEMTIFKEEIFGPVLCVTPFDTEEEAIALANNSKYGLAGGVFSNDGKRALRVAQKIKGGQIFVNSYFSSAMTESPGTGWKDSGIGPAGIYKYMTSKTMFISLDENAEPMG